MSAGASTFRPGPRHPLMGARPATLLSALAEDGPIRREHVPAAALVALSAAARAPFRPLEHLRLARLRRCTPRPEAPLFVIGHWRTGTTPLHELLASAPQLGHIPPAAAGLPDELLTLGTWLRPWLDRALPADRHVDRVAVRTASPQEDEIPLANMQRLSIFHALYFPRKFRQHAERGVFLGGCSRRQLRRWRRMHVALVSKVVAHQGCARLVIKNPVYTGRIALLHAIWPRAQFVHIRRNPYDVYPSTVHYFERMLQELSWQGPAHVDVPAFVLETFRRLMTSYHTQARDLAPEQLVDVRYEDLERAPLDVLSQIYGQLRLPGWRRARFRAARHLEAVRGYRKNRYTLSASDVERIRAAWGPFIRRGGYEPPDGAGAPSRSDM